MPDPDLLRPDALDRFHRDIAQIEAPDPGGHVVAFDGRVPLVFLRLRPFTDHAYRGPVIEAMALVLTLGADRVSMAMPGRAWSLGCPPPDDDGRDQRQHLLTQVAVDGHGDPPPQVHVRLHPYVVGSGPTAGSHRLTWSPPVSVDAGTSWLPRALETVVARRGELTAMPDADPVRQRTRLVGLGHVVLLTPAGERRLRSSPADRARSTLRP